MGSPVLDTADMYVLGKKLIESAALMEAGVAAILQAESEKIEKIVDMCPSKEQLVDANKMLENILKAIKEVEDDILTKIKNGKQLCGIDVEWTPNDDCDYDDNSGECSNSNNSKKEKEKQKEMEKELVKEKQKQKEIDKEKQKEMEKELEKEKQKQKEIDKEKKKEAEKEKQKQK